MTSRRIPSVLTLLGGMVLAVAFAPMLVLLLREQLHVNCSYGTEGEAAGSWMCADGIGYIVPGFGILLGSILGLLIALLLVLVMPGIAAAGARVLALMPPLWVGFTTGLMALRSDPLPESTWFALWWEQAGIAVLISALGAVLIAVAAAPAALDDLPSRLRRRAAEGARRGIRVRRSLVLVATTLGAILLVAGGLMQPGLMHAAAASAALIAVAWIARVSPAAERPALRTA